MASFVEKLKGCPKVQRTPSETPLEKSLRVEEFGVGRLALVWLHQASAGKPWAGSYSFC
jgi:hypothetical protein